jgi:hypothetical protein
MLDRQKIETLLARRFPGASTPQIAAAANAIMGLSDEWEEVTAADSELRILRRRRVAVEAMTGACDQPSVLN